MWQVVPSYSVVRYFWAYRRRLDYGLGSSLAYWSSGMKSLMLAGKVNKMIMSRSYFRYTNGCIVIVILFVQSVLAVDR
jgi:hypothetical protein